jgi:hypothetical protein
MDGVSYRVAFRYRRDWGTGWRGRGHVVFEFVVPGEATCTCTCSQGPGYGRVEDARGRNKTGFVSGLARLEPSSASVLHKRWCFSRHIFCAKEGRVEEKLYSDLPMYAVVVMLRVVASGSDFQHHKQ